MPELPEVETVKQILHPRLVGKTIERTEVKLPRMVRQPEPDEFVRLLQGLHVEAVDRRGKYLLIQLPPYTLVIHLRMEGKLSLHSSQEPLAPHVHLVFSFTDGTELRYKDVRTFGTFDLIPRGKEERIPGLAGLGPEPLSRKFTQKGLVEKLERKRRSPVKAALLDQRVVAGLGNIYVDEALHQARIDPTRLVASLTESEVRKIHRAVRDVLRKGIRAGGASVRSYRNSNGDMGYFQLQIRVYGKKGEPCMVCGNEIERIVVGGRGTHICRKCQN